jgi:FkbM family methyltransferase
MVYGMDYPLLPFLFRPYLKRELPGWGKLTNLLGINGIDNLNPRWRTAPKRTIRGKVHGYLMELDLSDDGERGVYFLGRYYDLENQLTLDAVLKSGDTFIDGGANIGMTTLHAARRVGEAGRVFAFEPQPPCAEKIQKHLANNHLTQIVLHKVGLSNKAAQLTLNVPGGGSIMANFSTVAEGSIVREQYSCSLIRGDDLVRGQIVGDLMIKLDIEGFELFALRGLEETIARHRPPILTEVVPHQLRRAGADEHQLFAHLHEREYRAHAILRKKSRRPVLALRPIERPEDLGEIFDVLWVPRSGSHFDPTPYLA